MTFLEIDSVSKTYKGAKKKCIDNLSIGLEEGEILVLLGPSGCGKTTLLKMISGLENIDEGTVTIDGKVMNNIAPHKRPIAMVFQKPLLFKNTTVEKNINISPRVNFKMNRRELHEKVLEMLKIVDLEGYEKRKASQLSGGQEQRVSLARALITEPKLLLLDEPFSALDAKLRVSMRENLRQICKSLNQTVIFVTHDQQEAVAIADRIALMLDGNIVQEGTPDIFYHRPTSRKSAEFFGWANAILAHQDGNKVSCALGDFRFDDLPSENKDVYLMMHPTAAVCSDDGKYEATVKEASYLGTFSNYLVDYNGLELSIQSNNRIMHLAGEKIRFDIDPKMLCPVDIPSEPESITEEEKE